MDWERVAKAARESGCTVTRRVALSSATTFRIGGEASLLIDVPSGAAAQKITTFCRERDVPVLWIGRGSNLLISDRGLSAAVLRMSAAERVKIEDERITAAAGTSLTTLCRAAREAGLAGLEFAFGIPGTVGGGVYMNAGAYGGELCDVLESAAVLTVDGRIETRPVSALGLGYRHSALMDSGEIVLEATVRLHADDPEAIAERMEDILRRRKEKQPLEYPSAGSFFKRPEGHFAGALIEQCGLKGFRVGDAQVSEKHAGFVVNRGHATCDEVRALADTVRARVLAETGVTLCPEVRLCGDRWPWEV